MEYMESGDKEEILEAIGVFAERIDERFEGINRRFEAVDRRFEIIESTMATKEDLKRFATKGDLRNFATKDDLRNFATKDDISNIMNTLDWLVGHAKKHEEEMLMMARGFRRLSDDVDKIKPLVGLA